MYIYTDNAARRVVEGIYLSTYINTFPAVLRRPGEIKSREVELGSDSSMDCLVAELLLNS